MEQRQIVELSLNQSIKTKGNKKTSTKMKITLIFATVIFAVIIKFATSASFLDHQLDQAIQSDSPHDVILRKARTSIIFPHPYFWKLRDKQRQKRRLLYKLRHGHKPIDSFFPL